MTRAELMVAIAGILLVAGVAGWILHWLFTRMRLSESADIEKLGDLAARLDRAEEARDAAVAERDRIESRLTSELSETERRLTAELNERQAELVATMASLGEVRRLNDQWADAYAALEAKRDTA